jgi:hypothetical protein
MKTKTLRTTCFTFFFLVAVCLSTLNTGLLAQPVINYTVSGTSGDYTLDFTINNTTPGTQGFDIYYFGVLVDGVASGSPQAYNSSYYPTIHILQADGPAYNWPFNNVWIDPSDSTLPTGMTLSGFEVSDTDHSAPTSVQYFAFGENNGLIYTGPGAVPDSSNPSNPLFVGNAVVAVPEPTTLSIIVGVSVLFLSGKLRRDK